MDGLRRLFAVGSPWRVLPLAAVKAGPCTFGAGSNWKHQREHGRRRRMRRMHAERLRSMYEAALEATFDLITRTNYGRRVLVPKYPYMFTPEQLWTLCTAAESALPLGGAFAEIGVWTGRTTVYLHRHILAKGPAPIYYCIDTFSGFTERDVLQEQHRGKDPKDYQGVFTMNSKRRFLRTMHVNGLDNTVVLRADAAALDYASIPPLSFALVDVDLYRPVKTALAGCFDRLVPGGVIVVDDCDPEVSQWDGAHQAYVEFCEERGLPIDIRSGKLGFVSKPIEHAR
jgi:predicted O-methyltransferase YrrM